jgi:hypothetical protein
VAELADAQDLGSCVLDVRVQIPPPALHRSTLNFGTIALFCGTFVPKFGSNGGHRILGSGDKCLRRYDVGRSGLSASARCAI